jgi:hypothetical protein
MILIAAIAVAAVAVAAVAVVVTGDDDSNDSSASSIDSKLLVYGNANNDYTINEDDLTVVQDIIDGNASLSDYPLADANCDGTVDSSDVDLLNQLISRTSGITVYVSCLDRSGNDTAVAVSYPLRNVVTYATNIQMPALYANGADYIIGYFASSYGDAAEKDLVANATDLGGSQRKISDTAWSNFTSLDASTDGGVGALLVDYSGISEITDARMSDLNDAGIPMISYSSADALTEFSTVLTLGFLFGGDSETVSVDYAELSWQTYDAIMDKVGDLTDDQKTSYIACTMYIYICGPDSSFNSTPKTINGLPYSEVNSEFASTYTGNSTKMANPEALSNYTDVDKIINNRSMDWGLDSDSYSELIVSTWDHSNSGTSSTEYFSGFEDKLFYVNNLLPGAAKMAYMAYVLYPDDFTLDWANSVLQSFIDTGTAPLSGQTLSTICAIISYSDYQSASSA